MVKKTSVPSKRSKTKAPPKSSARTRLPALNPARLALTLQEIEDSSLPEAAQQAISQSLRAATNPQAESPNVVIASLETEDQRAVRSAMPFYARTMNRMNARGRAALLGMSDAEFERRLNDSE